MVGFALFGAGRIGRLHAANLARHPRADLRWVYDVDAAAAAEVADLHDATEAPSLDDALRDDSVEAVLIASSTKTRRGTPASNA